MVSYINIWLLVVYFIRNLIAPTLIEPATTNFQTSSIRTSKISQSHPTNPLCPTARILPTNPLCPTARILLILPPIFPNHPSPQNQIGSQLTHKSPNMTQQLTTKKSNSLTVTLHTEPRINLRAWTKAVNLTASSMIRTLDPYGGLSLVCTDSSWALLRQNIFLPKQEHPQQYAPGPYTLYQQHRSLMIHRPFATSTRSKNRISTRFKLPKVT